MKSEPTVDYLDSMSYLRSVLWIHKRQLRSQMQESIELYARMFQTYRFQCSSRGSEIDRLDEEKFLYRRHD